MLKIDNHLKELNEVAGSYVYNKEFDKVKNAPTKWLEKYHWSKKEISLNKKEINNLFSFQTALAKYHPELEDRLNWKGEVPKDVIEMCGKK